MSTLSSIADSSSIQKKAQPVNGHTDSPVEFTAPHSRETQQSLVKPRFTGDVMMDNAHVGSKDRMNVRLTVDDRIRMASSDKVGTRNKGELFDGFADEFLNSRPAEVARSSDLVSHGPDSLIGDSDRSNMKKVITIHDPQHHINAMPSRNFEFGGERTNNDPYSFVGGNNSVPLMSFSKLKKTPGLDNVMQSGTKDFSKYDKLAKENFMKRMSERYLTKGK